MFKTIFKKIAEKFTWQEGRQGNLGRTYYKMPLFEGKQFDTWVLRYPANTGLVEHTDPVPSGFEHHRMNFILVGNAAFNCEKAYVNLPRFTYFRPDVMPHSVKKVPFPRVVLSFGWLKKAA